MAEHELGDLVSCKNPRVTQDPGEGAQHRRGRKSSSPPSPQEQQGPLSDPAGVPQGRGVRWEGAEGRGLVRPCSRPLLLGLGPEA